MTFASPDALTCSRPSRRGLPRYWAEIHPISPERPLPAPVALSPEQTRPDNAALSGGGLSEGAAPVI